MRVSHGNSGKAGGRRGAKRRPETGLGQSPGPRRLVTGHPNNTFPYQCPPLEQSLTNPSPSHGVLMQDAEADDAGGELGRRSRQRGNRCLRRLSPFENAAWRIVILTGHRCPLESRACASVPRPHRGRGAWALGGQRPAREARRPREPLGPGPPARRPAARRVRGSRG